MEHKTTYKNGYRQDYIVLDDGTAGTTDAQFIMNTICELCHKAGQNPTDTRRAFGISLKTRTWIILIHWWKEIGSRKEKYRIKAK